MPKAEKYRKVEWRGPNTLTVFWWEKRSSRVGSSCWHSLEETDTFRQTSMSTSKRMKLRKRRKTKVSLSEFGVTCHTAQHCLNALSFSLYGPLSFCRQIKAKESKSNFQKSIGEKVNIPVSCTHSPINISRFTLPCLPP